MDININSIKTLLSPLELISKYSLDPEDNLFIQNSRNEIKNILNNKIDKFIVIIGPCSIHNLDLALDYAKNIKIFQQNNPNLFIVMRVYFEKPRSRHGWKGFIYDPDLDETYNINKGLNLARELLVKLTKMKIPIGCEFLDTISPQYLADIVSWGAIGARTSESQMHRQLASGLSMPIGFKNLTDGDYKKAIDGILSARYPHHFLGIDYEGNPSHVSTKGNQDSHLILRGGILPNYYQKDVEDILKELKKEKIDMGIIIDCSHGNSQKEYFKQIAVACSINRLIVSKNKYNIKGVMIESNIMNGNQKLTKDISQLKYGVSITDACININASNYLLMILNAYKTTKKIDNLHDIRSYLNLFENNIIQSITGDDIEKHELLLDNIESPNIIINYDDELFDIIKSVRIDPILLCLLHKRLSTSELIASIKYDMNIYNFLLKNNDYYKLVTDRTVEKNILNRVQLGNSSPINSPILNTSKNTDLFIKIMELSKRIQVKYLEKYISMKKIGYIGTNASFSYEVIDKNFNGIHVGYKNMNELYKNLDDNIIDYAIIPTYNSLVGIVFDIPTRYNILGSIDHKIELSLYRNNKLGEIKRLYIQEIVLKESIQYIQNKFNNIEIILCETTEDSCIKCIQDSESITISSKYNKCNFFKLLDDNIVDHNITTFSLIKI
jgi:3-deoxy-7-phosphoheptulonate synthase